MYTPEKYLGSSRIGVFTDAYIENSFVVSNSDMVFARITKIGTKWVVWFYKLHIQKEFEKLREAVTYVNQKFITWYGENK